MRLGRSCLAFANAILSPDLQKESIVFRNPGKGGQASFFWKDDGVENMGVQTVWARLAPGIEDYWA